MIFSLHSLQFIIVIFLLVCIICLAIWSSYKKQVAEYKRHISEDKKKLAVVQTAFGTDQKIAKIVYAAFTASSSPKVKRQKARLSEDILLKAIQKDMFSTGQFKGRRDDQYNSIEEKYKQEQRKDAIQAKIEGNSSIDSDDIEPEGYYDSQKWDDYEVAGNQGVYAGVQLRRNNMMFNQNIDYTNASANRILNLEEKEKQARKVKRRQRRRIQGEGFKASQYEKVPYDEQMIEDNHEEEIIINDKNDQLEIDNNDNFYVGGEHWGQGKWYHQTRYYLKTPFKTQSREQLDQWFCCEVVFEQQTNQYIGIKAKYVASKKQCTTKNLDREEIVQCKIDINHLNSIEFKVIKNDGSLWINGKNVGRGKWLNKSLRYLAQIGSGDWLLADVVLDGRKFIGMREQKIPKKTKEKKIKKMPKLKGQVNRYWEVMNKKS